MVSRGVRPKDSVSACVRRWQDVSESRLQDVPSECDAFHGAPLPALGYQPVIAGRKEGKVTCCYW